MFSISDYFVAGNAYHTYNDLVFMFIFMTLMILISFILFFKTYFSLKKTKNEANKYLLRSMFGIILWNLGEWILTVTELLSNTHWGILSGIDNIPLALGLVLTVNSFFSYIQINLKIHKYKQRRKLLNLRIFSFIKFLSITSLYLFILRFLALPFMSSEGKDESENIIIIILVFLSFLVITLMLIMFIQLVREKKVLSSKLDLIRVNFYLVFLVLVLFALINVWIFLLGYLIEDLKPFSNIVIYFIYIPSVLAILCLYYGLFLPDWLQKRLGLLPSF